MSTGKRPKAFPLAFIVLYIFFCLESVYPKIVICYRQDGTTAIEFELDNKECQCEKCLSCRERRLIKILGETLTLPQIRSCQSEDNRCRHEEINSEAGQTSLNNVKKFVFPSVASAAPWTDRLNPTEGPGSMITSGSNDPNFTSAMAGLVLRC